jgi:hypothetical protein
MYWYMVVRTGQQRREHKMEEKGQCHCGGETTFIDGVDACMRCGQEFAPPDDSCPGCGCAPGEGTTEGCNHPVGCGFNRQLGEESYHQEGEPVRDAEDQ